MIRTRTFRLPICESLEPRSLFANGGLDVTIGDSAARRAQFTDSDGTAVTVSFRGGAAALHFTGDGLAQAADDRSIVVTGTNVALATVTGTGTSRKSTLAFKGSGGDGRVGVGGITVDGAIMSVSGPSVILTGPLTIAGPASRVNVFRTENSTIQLGAGNRTSVVTIAEVVDTDLTSASPLRLDLGSWGGLGGGGAINALSISRLTAPGSFQGNITVGSAGVLDFGTIQDTTIQATGSIGRLRGRTADLLRVDVDGSITSVDFTYLTRSQIYAGVRPLPEDAPIPTTVADFVAPSSISRLRISEMDNTRGTIIAARFVRKAAVWRVPADSNLRNQIIADRIDRVSGTTLIALKDLNRFRRTGLESEVVDLRALTVTAL